MSDKHISSYNSSTLSRPNWPWFGRRICTLFVLIGLLIIGSLSSFDTAEARRIGNGRSFGRQSQTINRQSATQRQQTMQQTIPSQAHHRPTSGPLRSSQWLGPLAGLVAGLGIAGLISHFGFGEAFSGMVSNLIVISIFLLAAIWLIRKITGFRKNADLAHANDYITGSCQFPFYANDEQTFQSRSYMDNHYNNETPYGSKEQSVVTNSLNTDAFLRNAKVYFIRLQAAWDQGNMQDIREFTTPEMFAEIKLDFEERGNEKNQTDIVQLDAELLDVEDHGKEHIASVRFHGLIRESLNDLASPFEEVWNLSRCGSNGWVLAGIQQLVKRH
ncbi:MAG: TIM44-like domain-containing protein [Burkholderia sp.]|nr:TIM44-like domain-containing protein [Burkholderia sp.]